MKAARPNRRDVVAAALALGCAGKAWAQDLPVDESVGSNHPSSNAALQLFLQRDWDGLSQLVASAPPQAALWLVGDLGDVAPPELNLDGLEERPMGATILAALHVGWAWRHRGHGLANTLTAAAVQGFTTQLRLAKGVVARAIEADPQDGVARTTRFRIDMGLSDLDGLHAGLAGFLSAARRPVGGLSVYANAIGRRWLGSDQEALAFARQNFRIDLPASTGLIAGVHYDVWSSIVLVSASRNQPAPGFDVYLAQPAIREDIIAANEYWLSLAPDPDPFANLYAHSRLAFALLNMGEDDLARPHLVGMGDYISGPWVDVPEPRRTLDRIRSQLGLHAL